MSPRELSVAIYVPTLQAGGVERMRINLSRVFLDRGMKVTFLLHRAEGELLSMVPREAEVVSLESGRTLQAVPRLAQHLRRHRPDILLSSLGHNNIAAIWARRLARVDTRVVICQHNALSSESAAVANWQHRALPGLYRRFWRGADGIVAVSVGVADDMAAAAGIPRDRISVIYNPVLSPTLVADASKHVPHPWLDDPDLPVFVAVGRLVPQKDFATLIRAFAALDPARGARLVILGEGPLRASLAALARELNVADRVELAGFHANPFAFVRRARALVMSSAYEGFGNVLVEALACGTPVISTDCPHGPAEILEGGRFGALVPVGDPAALARAMEATLDGRRDPGELRARAQEFEVGRIADRYVDLFRSVLDRPPATGRIGRGAMPAPSPAGTSPLPSVAIYMPRLVGGGAEVAMLRLAQGLTQRGVKVTFVVHRADAIPPVFASPARVVSLQVDRSLTAVPGLVRELRRSRPDVLVSAFSHNNVLAVLAGMLSRTGVSVVLTEHTPVSLHVQMVGGLRYRTLPWLLPLVYRRAASIVAVAAGVRDDLRRLLAPGAPPIQVIHNPVLPSNWRELAREPVDHPWLNDPGLRTVLSVARLSPEKNLPALLRAFARVRASLPQARLLVVGDGSQRPALEAQISAMGLTGAAAIVGWVNNPFAYMQRARVLVLSSDVEGFGNVLVEAMACGTPVVSTDCPYGPGEVLGGGAYGDLVPVGDEQALTEAILRALDGAAGPPARAGARERALEFTVERSAAQYLELFQRLRPAGGGGQAVGATATWTAA